VLEVILKGIELENQTIVIILYIQLPRQNNQLLYEKREEARNEISFTNFAN